MKALHRDHSPHIGRLLQPNELHRGLTVCLESPASHIVVTARVDGLIPTDAGLGVLVALEDAPGVDEAELFISYVMKYDRYLAPSGPVYVREYRSPS